MGQSSKFILACFFLIGVASASAAPSRADIAGTYTAAVGGKTLTLVLDADGTGSLGGESGRWSLSGRAITLLDNAGEGVTGTVNGDTLTFTVEGTTLRFVKQSSRVAAKRTESKAGRTTSKAGKPFKPKLVSGKTVRIEEAKAKVRVPRGWSHAWGQGVDGKDAYNLSNKDKTIGISLGRTMLTGEDAAADPATLLEAALTELLEGAAAERVVNTESFTVAGKPAGRVVVRAPVNNVELEGYLGVIVIDGWAFSVVALYRASDAKKGRAAADTVLATLRAKAPKRNKALMSKMTKCWEYYKSYDGGQTQIKLNLRADGTFSRVYFTSISVAGASSLDEDKEAGTWTVIGKTLTLTPEGGKAVRTYNPRFKGYAMFLGDTRYRPCG